MSVTQKIIDVETTSGTMAVLHTAPDGDVAGRVGIFFDAPGIRDATEAFCKKLAGEGYEVVVPDLYHRGERLFQVTAAKREADPSIVDRMRELMAALDDAEIQQDMDDAMAAVGWSDGPVGCIGFCLGARAVHKAVTRDAARFVAGSMFHPSFLADDNPGSPHLTAGDVTSQMHIGIGTADKVQSIEMHQPYFDAIASLDNVELNIFDGANHGYTWPENPDTYHQEAAETCFQKTLAIFAATLNP